jgi:hypothetical protein
MNRYGRPVKIVTADQPGGRPRVRVPGAVRRVRASGLAGPPMLRAELRYDLGTDAAGGPVPGS